METHEREEQARWFADEVHPHEGALRSYLRASFPTVQDVDDVVQESYIRVLRSRTRQPLRSARAFLYKVARHLALDRIRRQRVSPVETVGDLSSLSVMEEGRDAVAAASMSEKIDLLGQAVAALPARCRQIVILRKLEGLSQKEVAAKLGISERTVEVQVSRGVRKCEDFLARRGLRGWYDESP